MPVAFDAQAFKDLASTGGTFTIVPVGVPRGIAVLIVQNAVSTDLVTAVSYGGGTLTRFAFATDTVTEPGAAYGYYRGDTVAASGTVNVVLTAGGTATAWAATFTANQGTVTQITTVGSLNEDHTNPSVTLATGATANGVAIAALYSGLGAPTNATAGVGFTKLTGSATGGRQFTASCGCAEYQALSGANVTAGFTAASDDCAFVAAFVQEVVSPISEVNFVPVRAL